MRSFVLIRKVAETARVQAFFVPALTSRTWLLHEHHGGGAFSKRSRCVNCTRPPYDSDFVQFDWASDGSAKMQKN